MKKIIALIMVLLMVLGLAACGGSSNTPAQTTTEPTEDAIPWTEVEGIKYIKYVHSTSKNKSPLWDYEEENNDEFAYDEMDNQLYIRSISGDGYWSENVFTYDGSGNMLSWVCSAKDEGVYSETYYTYDDAGRRIRMEDLSQTWGNSVTVFEYDDNDNLIKEVTESADGVTTCTYEYNEHGDETLMKVQGPDSDYEVISEYTYEGDKIVKCVATANYYKENETSKTTTLTEYHANGKMKKSTMIDDNYTNVNEYDENENLILATYIGEESSSETKYEYNSDNKVTRSVNSDSDGTVSESVYEYDAQGREILMLTKDTGKEYTAEYRYETTYKDF